MWVIYALLAAIFACLFLKEQVSPRVILGACLITAGGICMIVK